MKTRTSRIQVLVNDEELAKLKRKVSSNNTTLSAYLRLAALREQQQISNSDYEVKVKASIAEIKDQLSQVKMAIINGKQPSIAAINNIIEIADNL